MHFNDPYGRVTRELDYLSQTVAYARQLGMPLSWCGAISLVQQNRDTQGFRLNSARTRNLFFHKI